MTYNPAIAVSVAHDCLGTFFKALLLEFSSHYDGIQMGDLPNLLDGGVYGDGSYSLHRVDATHGVMTNPEIAVTSVSPVEGTTDATFTVGVTLSGHVTYSDWHETGSQSHTTGGPGGGTHIDPFDNLLHDFTFDLVAMPVDLTVTITMSSDSMDPDDAAKKLQVSVGNADTAVAQATITNVNPPSDSVINVGDFFGAFSSGGPAALAAATRSTDVVTPFIAATNTLFQTVPDSGKVTPDLRVLFPPETIEFPTGGGFRMSVSGILMTGDDTVYPTACPRAVAMPDLPASGMTIAANEFLLNEIAWYESKAGHLDIDLPRPGAPVDPWNTDRFEHSLAKLWDFAPSSPITMAVRSDPSVPPIFTPIGAWQPSVEALAPLGLPADVSSRLLKYQNHIFVGAPDLAALLDDVLTPDEFSQFGGNIVTVSAGHGYSLSSQYAVTATVSHRGQEVVVLSCTISTLHTIDSVGMKSDVTAGTQAVTFTLQYEDYEMTAAKWAGVSLSDQDAQTFISATLEPELESIFAALEALGEQGAAVPAMPGFVLQNPVLKVVATGFSVTGDAVTT